ncbi:MAG: DinB family protein [Anaerolineales bacterium]
MNGVNAIREGIQWGTEILEMVMAGVTDEQARWAPPGLANPIGALYAHAYLAADGIVHGMLQGVPPLYASTWADKVGVEAPQMSISFEWARGLQPDLAALRLYGQAVTEAISAYTAKLGDDDLDRVIDLSGAGLGQRPVSWVLNALIAGHHNNMAGEISALKGAQGAQGYPF